MGLIRPCLRARFSLCSTDVSGDDGLASMDPLVSPCAWIASWFCFPSPSSWVCDAERSIKAFLCGVKLISSSSSIGGKGISCGMVTSRFVLVDLADEDLRRQSGLMGSLKGDDLPVKLSSDTKLSLKMSL